MNYELIEYFGEKSILFGIANIDEIKRMEYDLTIHASIDILTGVFNGSVGMNLIRKSMRWPSMAMEDSSFALSL